MGLFRRRRHPRPSDTPQLLPQTPDPRPDAHVEADERLRALGVDPSRLREQMGSQLALMREQLVAEAERRRALPTYLVRLHNGILLTQSLDDEEREQLDDAEGVEEIIRLAQPDLIDYQGQHLVMMINALGFSEQ